MGLNPFAILGIHQDVVATQPDKVLEELITANYRVMQKHYHPDAVANKSDTKARILAEARDLLDRKKNPLSYSMYKARYVKKIGLKIQLEELEEKVLEVKRQSQQQASNLIGYFKAIYGQAENTVFNCRSITLGMADTVRGLNRRGTSCTTQAAKERSKALSLSDIIVDADGLIYLDEGDGPKLKNMVLIGVISNNDRDKFLRRFKQLMRARQSDRLLGSSNASEPVQYSYTLTAKEMELLAPLLRTELMTSGYLFSLFVGPGGELMFRLEGYIREIKKI